MMKKIIKPNVKVKIVNTNNKDLDGQIVTVKGILESYPSVDIHFYIVELEHPNSQNWSCMKLSSCFMEIINV